MASYGRHSVSMAALVLFSFLSLVDCTCYTAAFGLVGKQDQWIACPGTASSTGGVETCCSSGSACGEDSLCHDPSEDRWYVAGCTDANYQEGICRNDCSEYTTTFIQYSDANDLWMCCGDGGCNGTVTDDTFSAVSPDDWNIITGDSDSLTPSPSSTPPTPTSSPPSPTSTVVPLSSSTSEVDDSGTSSTQSALVRTETETKTRRKPSRPTGSADSAQEPSRVAEPSASSTPAVATAETNNDNSDQESGSGLGTGAKVGIGVAVGVALVALIVAILAVYMLRRSRKHKEPITEAMQTSDAKTLPPSYPPSYVEIGRSSKRMELPTEDNTVHELPVRVSGGKWQQLHYNR